MKLLYYIDPNISVCLGEILTNHSLSVDDILKLLDINMAMWAQKQGYDNWEYDALYLQV